MKKIIPVILCGGSGTRLWPLSRQKMPKQFLKLIDDHTLLQKTALRTLEVLNTGAENLVTITLGEMAEETGRQLKAISPAATRHILREPEARNTAAAVAYAIQYVQSRFGPDSYIWILPADHYIGDNRALSEAVDRAQTAAEKGYLVTFGINPTRPETGYGYIQKAQSLNGSGTYRVRKFHEKPDAETAKNFVESGQYLWSSGMHLFTAAAGKSNFEEHAPETWNCVAGALRNSGDFTRPSGFNYCQARKEPFETAVMEKSRRVAVIPCDPKWSDIGSWESLWEVKNNKDDNGNACNGNVYYEDTRNSMILAQDRLVTCVGMEDVIVIETGDSVLVANKNCGNSLKKLVGLLREQNKVETVNHSRYEHDWGDCKNVYGSENALIRECRVRQGQAYYHNQKTRSQWLIAQGNAVFVRDGLTRKAGKDEIVVLESGKPYEIINTGEGDLILYEMRFGIADKRKPVTGHMHKRLEKITLPGLYDDGMAA